MVFSPVFDNGASFNTKSSDEQINPFEHIENDDCDEALVKLVPNINLDEIKKFICDIPNEFNGVFIIKKRVLF